MAIQTQRERERERERERDETGACTRPHAKLGGGRPAPARTSLKLAQPAPPTVELRCASQAVDLHESAFRCALSFPGVSRCATHTVKTTRNVLKQSGLAESE